MKKIIAGNWKMHKTRGETRAFIEQLSAQLPHPKNEVWLAVPFTSLAVAAESAKGKPFSIGAQNMHDEVKGAFTGEISLPMLQDAGASFVILGHSERRRLFHESNAFIHRKVKRALEGNLKVILCVGETQEERDLGKTEKVLYTQLTECLDHFSSHLVVAYEPVWAIGTGKSATPEIAEEVHKICRHILTEKWGEENARRIPLLYGGSVTGDTVHSLMQKPNIDGALVGGASLDATQFSDLITKVQK